MVYVCLFLYLLLSYFIQAKMLRLFKGLFFSFFLSSFSFPVSCVFVSICHLVVSFIFMFQAKMCRRLQFIGLFLSINVWFCFNLQCFFFYVSLRVFCLCAVSLLSFSVLSLCCLSVCVSVSLCFCFSVFQVS